MKVKARNKVSKTLSIIFTGVGLFTLIVCLILIFNSNHFIKNAYKVQGTILAQQDKNNANRGTIVSYTLHNQAHTAFMKEYSSFWHVGEKITLYVDKRNLDRVKSKSLSYLAAFIIGGVSLVFLLIGLIFAVCNRRTSLSTKRLKSTGKRVVADVISGKPINSISVNRKRPYVIDCSYQDEITGLTYLYRSNYIWEEPSALIGRQVSVYIDRNNPKQYYVDTDELTNKHESNMIDYR